MKDIAVSLNALPTGCRAVAGWLALARAVRGTAQEKIFRSRSRRRVAGGVDNRRNGVNTEAKGSRRPSCVTSTKSSGGSSR